MAPPTNKPRLNQLDPESVALEAAADAYDRVQAMSGRVLGRAFALQSREGAGALSALLKKTPAYQNARALADYALTGKRPKKTVEELVDALDVLADQIEAEEDREPVHALGVVVQAAMARDLLDRAEPANDGGALLRPGARALAVLASLSTRQCRELVGAGTLQPDHAKRFLAARGVAGFEGGRS